ncbi:MAG TPA: ATP synthase F1 subunit gamma [Desulfobacterales bacterium]|nr:ATP synthase F1 subunit gamma [Desulfobacterales bacterium]
MPSLKDVQRKISGVKKTSQITKAMNMVASAKLRGAQERMQAFRPYKAKFNEAMASVAGHLAGGGFPLMEVRPAQTVEIIVITADRGLCGSFNANIIARAESEAKALEAEGKKVRFVGVGKKGARYFKRTGKLRQAYEDIMGTFQMFNAREIAQDSARAFLDGEIDECRLVYGQFVSVVTQKPTVERLLPIAGVEEGDGEETGPAGDFIYEPGPEEIMDVLLPLYLNVMVYHAMLEVSASEHAARMTAMDNATNACKDMIHDLTLLYNKARQAGITAELMDIVGGAEALKG